ncbi:MAG TPA: hypothetical protein HA319_06480, partial [Nitrosopumilaceae archaeon]|nr:hypothetical protein [Nitrosopumilaceae archaeon]
MKWFPDKKKKDEEKPVTTKLNDITGDNMESVSKNQDQRFDLKDLQSNIEERENITDAVFKGHKSFGVDDNVKDLSDQTEQTQIGDAEIGKIIELVLSSKEDNIIPSVNYEENRWSYPLLEQLGSPEHVSALLEEISSPSVNVLEKGEFERL